MAINTSWACQFDCNSLSVTNQLYMASTKRRLHNCCYVPIPTFLPYLFTDGSINQLANGRFYGMFRMTVDEHLWFYARLKGMPEKDVKREMDQ